MSKPNEKTVSIEEEQAVAASIQAVLCRKGDDGEYVYSKTEVRDFIALCVLKLKVDVPPDLEPAMLGFFRAIGGAQAEDADALEKLIVGYFEENPLNPELLVEFEAVGQAYRGGAGALASELGFKDAGKQLQALKAIGGDGELNAPKAKPQKKRARKVSRGIGS